ncbi:MAG TPA: tryptophan 7-halogenase [Pyrinomonadaceae bacterium]|nr:tryptophan 7-halogenase [Pyrinomonadaceae bacterium]
MSIHENHSCDVAILGGGPAGTATALSLRAHAPSLSVTLIEQSNYNALRIGETLPPSAQPLLEQLGIWSAFQKEGHLPAYGTCATWGTDELFENEFIFHRAGVGWHLDRKRFDAMLAREATKNGVQLICNGRFTDAEKINNHWEIGIQDASGEEVFIDASFVVDATGRRAAFASQQGVRKIFQDQLLGVFVFFQLDDNEALADTYTLVEPWEDGWWYSALVPGNQLAVACMTDGDVAKKYRLNSSDGWFDLIGKTTHTSKRIHGAIPLAAPSAYPASSHRLEKMTGEGWLAVGDAATTFDPLSSLGIQKGLRSGITASYAIGDFFNGSPAGQKKYEALLSQEFEAYLVTKSEFYRQEQRWSSSSFWQRRYDYITLDPSLLLHLNQDAGKLAAVDRLSMHLPSADLKDLRDLCATPRAASEIVSAFNTNRRMSDRRVILALQYLLEAGAIIQPA